MTDHCLIARTNKYLVSIYFYYFNCQMDIYGGLKKIWGGCHPSLIPIPAVFKYAFQTSLLSTTIHSVCCCTVFESRFHSGYLKRQSSCLQIEAETLLENIFLSYFPICCNTFCILKSYFSNIAVGNIVHVSAAEVQNRCT